MSFDENTLYNIKTSLPGTRCPLFDLAIWKNGLAFKKIDFSEDGVPVIKIAELNNGIGSNTSFTEGDYGEEVRLHQGDLLFSWSGNPQTSIDVYKYQLDDGWLNQHIFKVTANETMVSKDFLFYLLKYLKPHFTQIATNKQTTGLGHVTIADLKRMSVVVPEKIIQDRIVAVVKTIDDKIEVNNEINKNLLQLALCLFETLISGKSKNGFIGDYCTVKSGFAFKSKWWQTSGVPVIKIGNINQDSLNLTDCSYVSEDKVSIAKDFIVTGGDVLMAMTGATIGKFAMVPVTTETILVNQRVGKFFLGNKPVYRVPFIYCTLKQPDIVSEVINRGQGSAQPNISASDIMNIPCVIPSEDDIHHFNQTTLAMFETIISNQYENVQLASLRDTLLPKLMSGELDVSDIDL